MAKAPVLIAEPQIFYQPRPQTMSDLLDQSAMEIMCEELGITADVSAILLEVHQEYICKPLTESWDTYYRQSTEEVLYGYHDATWLSFYAFWRDEIKLECVEPMSCLLTLAQACGWWAPFNEVVVVQARHSYVFRNADGRLHNESGPCAMYPDGYCMYAIEGIPMSEKIVMDPQAMTVEEIDNEQNVEKRRIMRERFGVSRYLHETGAKIIDSDTANAGNLRALWRDRQGLQWLEGTDGSTGRVYFMNVSRDARTCAEAHTSICGFPDNLCIMES